MSELISVFSQGIATGQIVEHGLAGSFGCVLQGIKPTFFHLPLTAISALLLHMTAADACNTPLDTVRLYKDSCSDETST